MSNYLCWRVLFAMSLSLAGVLLTGCEGDDAETVFTAAVTHAASARWDEALKTAAKAQKINPSHVSSRILTGLALYHVGKMDRAEEVLRSGAQDFPADFASQHFYGWIMCDRGKYQDALPPLRKAHEIRPEHDATTALLARCLLEQGLPEEGIPLFTSLRKSPLYGKGAIVDTSIAMLYLYQGDMVKAKNHLFAALRREPDNPVVARNVAVFCDQYLAAPRDAVRYYSVARNLYLRIGDEKQADMLKKRIAQIMREPR
ncbi:MAG: tetratricopeptide repeat protein [Lentisphaeria bacterium]|nr:tetratricopeptide repeat protein [Lentisphaeria bacterium]